MSITAKKENSFTPAPEGQWGAVCCDVVDLGIIESKWNDQVKKQHKIKVVFQIDEINPENKKPYIVQQRFTLSMHEKASLRQFLESWRGKPYSDGEATKGVDVELMIGQNAVIQVVHNVKNGDTWANIQSIMRPMKGMRPLAVSDYVRVKDRPPEEQKAKPATVFEPRPDDRMDDFPEPLDDDDSLPF